MAPGQQSDAPALAAYYRRPAVRARIREYCGLEDPVRPLPVFLSASLPKRPPPIGWTPDPHYPPSSLDALLDLGADVFRSVWDRVSLPICLDLDYLNAERPGHALACPAEVFAKLEPTYAVIVEQLHAFDLDMMALMTGRGYQFSGRIPLTSPAIDQLAQIVPAVPDWHETQDRRLPGWITDRFTGAHARAYVGTGMVLEHLAHLVIRSAAPRSPIPLVLNGTNVGGGALGGREAVSLDLSFAGDPLDARHIRSAYSGYQQHRFRPDIYGPAVSALDPLVTVPRAGRPIDEMLHTHRTPRGAARLAASTSARIPLVSGGVPALIAAYRRSPLAPFHAAFYATVPHEPDAWPETYDRLDLTRLPACVSSPLAAPNDRLLKPEHLQHVTRFLLSEGWAPRHIAGLIWSRYGKNFDWGERWAHLSARARAEFDVRAFAGLIATGVDRGVDFNCRSAQEKELCPFTPCPYDLRISRGKLLAQHA